MDFAGSSPGKVALGSPLQFSSQSGLNRILEGLQMMVSPTYNALEGFDGRNTDHSEAITARLRPINNNPQFSERNRNFYIMSCTLYCDFSRLFDNLLTTEDFEYVIS